MHQSRTYIQTLHLSEKLSQCDDRVKCKWQNYKISRREHTKNKSNFAFGNEFSDITPKA